ncbi:putative cysteine proteinase inhibitor 7 [Brachypodium distachyon]|uniref:Cystatin domain-containing protein n=1 Tax=Brachypodium distachyon TaxID=15368 RepID=I1GL16_BRADI|nr:putative cysteine proteinase inhibitor 7 [Brachypodium distachyon]KQK12211.1 hypothetical protein BRADI_1g02200v3 [Brachypodium distachyon]|eukprot:XP_003559169.1 putative cysteine proteinase inhibitor 7 [Brachypodium distachyon]
MRTSSSSLIFLHIAVAGAMISGATGCGEPFKQEPGISEHHLYVGSWEPILNLNDPSIRELGSWAVAQYGMHANCRLKFNKVVSGRKQLVPVAGVTYELFIDASPELAAAGGGSSTGLYKAVVHEKAGANSRKLVSFAKAKL